MNTLCLIGTLLVAFPVTGRSEPVTEKLRAIVEARMPARWHLSTDHQGLIASASNIRLLNPISLPANPEAKRVWDEFSWESDFHIQIRITPKIDDEDYAALLRLRSDFLDRRIRDWEKERGEKIDGKSRSELVNEVHATISLPYCHSETLSIWISSTDNGILMTRPETARDFSDSLRKALAEQFTVHEKKR